jgi:hypothetical protein
MDYSTFDKEGLTYLYRRSQHAPKVYLSPAYLNAPFVAWEDVYIELPNDATTIGRGEEARGVLTHPKEIEKSVAPSSLTILGERVEIFGILWLAGRVVWSALFGGNK